ncbi:hypothetical protein [Pseudomonas aeruginosa]|uniref:hypothetical protein n=1 Tax=Pseudomonas aeruginosa TaxID=287 RepID=UPI001EED63FA|nr:hypothetical protein [Pseudomonas aeruginosa]MCG7130088.1 hypothetical protein [Pseudomonas aeruginosa]MCG7153261.1 hypothetical protein [Pseudomonas aeruginosa]MCG7165788.1 hypothetical protein [Pseudomonas aeruginosa]MCG7171654.1 hypothetical protein [Pseudomonas aeruginosa]HDP4807087.1 hypothetical protein [Pseudomonas aeruginosa]
MNILSANQIADDAIEQLRCSHQQARWMAALMTAIHTELDLNPAMLEARVARAKDLASLGEYLSMDLANHTDCRVEELQAALDQSEGMTQ